MHPTHPPTHILARIPWWISRWLGYRATTPPKLPDWEIWVWSFIGAFGGLGILQGVFGHDSYFIHRGVPPIIASYGASAVLIYGAIEGPLSQPRQLMGGHFIGALTGICISKLFQQLPTEERFHQLQWLCGAISTALAIVFMQMTGTTHPPAGSTALLAAINSDVIWLSWYYLPVILLSSTLALAVALLVNNIRRRYPVYWFIPTTPAPNVPSAALGGPEKRRGAPPSSPATSHSSSPSGATSTRTNSRVTTEGHLKKQI
jgi:CBS-domain-containing membrane protein